MAASSSSSPDDENERSLRLDENFLREWTDAGILDPVMNRLMIKIQQDDQYLLVIKAMTEWLDRVLFVVISHHQHIPEKDARFYFPISIQDIEKLTKTFPCMGFVETRNALFRELEVVKAARSFAKHAHRRHPKPEVTDVMVPLELPSRPIVMKGDGVTTTLKRAYLPGRKVTVAGVEVHKLYIDLVCTMRKILYWAKGELGLPRTPPVISTPNDLFFSISGIPHPSLRVPFGTPNSTTIPPGGTVTMLVPVDLPEGTIPQGLYLPREDPTK